MLTTRRKKQRAKKRLATIAKQEKKQTKQTLKTGATKVAPTPG